MQVQKSELRASVLTLVYRLSKSDVVLSLLAGVGVALFVFVMSGRMDLQVDAQRTGVTNEIWRVLFAWLPMRLSPEMAKLTHRVVGSVTAGLAAWTAFVMLRSVLFMLIASLRIDEFLRIRRVVYFWLAGIPLTVFVSRSATELFSMFSPETFFFVLAICTTMLMVGYFLTKRVSLAIVAYLILGALSAMSIIGVVTLVLLAVMLTLARIHSVLPTFMSTGGSGYGYGGYGGYGYGGYGYGSYGYGGYGDRSKPMQRVNENPHLVNPFVMDRLRLIFSFTYLVGLLVTLGVLFALGFVSGMGAKEIVMNWVGCMSAEATKMVTLNGCALIVGGVVVPMIFAFKNLNGMLNEEHFLSMMEIVRLLIALFASFGMLVLLDRLIPDNIAVVSRSVQVVVQSFAGLSGIVAAVVFLVDIKCHNKNVQQEDMDEYAPGQSGLFKLMMKPILFIITILPLAMVAASFLLAK